MYWYWYVSWRVCQWKHANTDHNTYQYHPNISAAGVKVNPYWYVLWYVLVCFWYVLVCFGMYLKPLWHTGLGRAQVVLVRIGYVLARIWVCIDPYIGSIHTKMTRILWICICSARIGMYWSCWYCLCTYWYHAFPRFAFNAPQSVFAAASCSRFGSQSAGWSEGKTMAHELMSR